MNLANYRETYYTLSGKASDVSRHLSFAGIAVIWLFRNSNSGPIAVPQELLVPASLFILALAFDLAQYVFGAGIWGAFTRYHEGTGTSEDQELSAPTYLNWPTIGCFWLKIAFVLTAYCLVFWYVLARLQYP